MTVPCTSCGEILDPADDRCPYCGTLAPPPPGTSVFAHEVDEPRWADPTTVTPPIEDPTAVGDPLSIPIREPGAPVRRSGGDDSGVPRPVLVALVAVAVMAFVAVVAAQVLGSDGGGDLASAGGTSTTEPDTGDEVAADDVTTTTSEPPSSTTPSSTTTSTTTSTPTTTTSTAPSTTTTARRPPASGAGSVPTLPRSFTGGWVAQLSSVPASAGTASLEAAYARIRADVPGAVAARSDEWPSLSAGYWVFVETGFGSEDEVRSFCSSVDRSGDACLPRELAGRR